MKTEDRSLNPGSITRKIAREYLGPFSSEDESRIWEVEVCELVGWLADSLKRDRVSMRDRIRLLREIAEPGKLFARKIRGAPPAVKVMLSMTLGIDTTAIVADLDDVVTKMSGLATFLGESLDMERPKKGRGEAWIVSQKKKLLLRTQQILKERGKPHGLSRIGNVTDFATDVWNCAQGTTLDVDAFSYAIDHLQREKRTHESQVASFLASVSPTESLARRTQTKHSPNGSS